MYYISSLKFVLRNMPLNWPLLSPTYASYSVVHSRFLEILFRIQTLVYLVAKTFTQSPTPIIYSKTGTYRVMHPINFDYYRTYWRQQVEHGFNFGSQKSFQICLSFIFKLCDFYAVNLKLYFSFIFDSILCMSI